jgi:pimeloyl-ACP methyl ester carboxylesterase
VAALFAAARHPGRLRSLVVGSSLAAVPLQADLLPQINTPVQIIAGAHDTAVPPANARFLHERLPHSRLDIIDTGHFTRVH